MGNARSAKWARLTSMIPSGLAPPPTALPDGRTVVAAELVALQASLTFDVERSRAEVEAAVTFVVASEACAAFDLRQPLAAAHLDGSVVEGEALAHADLGGGPGSAMRVTASPLASGSEHRLELAYALGVPAVEDPLPIRWQGGGVRFDVWGSDLSPARYLEQWLPVSLCQDRFPLTLEVAVVGTVEPHSVVSNAEVTSIDDRRWRLVWPARHTSLSSMFVLAPTRDLRSASVEGVDLTLDADVAEDPEVLARRVAAWLVSDREAFGPSVHPSPFVAHVWQPARGMEYDGATTASAAALEHEVFHSWFGRGVKPASASDGWIDEALATWWTSDHPEAPRRSAVPLDLDEPPCVLAPPSPWSRHTPRAAYRTGYRLIAELAHRAGGPIRGVEAVSQALAAYYGTRAGGFATTDDLQQHLCDYLGLDLGPWWDRYVRGRSSAAGAGSWAS